MMRVRLLSYTQYPEELVAIAACNCVSGLYIDKIETNCLSKDKIRRVIDTLKKNQHYSVFEHACFTFGIEEVSRVLLAQITRHRIASFSVRSMRYAPINRNLKSMVGSTFEDQMIMAGKPIPFDENTEAVLDIYKNAYSDSVKHYDELLNHGVSQENARYVLPNACMTSIVLTMNARELMHFFGLRCCKHAQSEIRALANRMSDLVMQVAPILFEGMNGPRCEQLGYCPEGKRSCHKKPTLEEILTTYNKAISRSDDDVNGNAEQSSSQ